MLQPLRRRTALALGAAAALATPSVQASTRRVLRFVPNGEPPVLDPYTNTIAETRIHGLMIWDTLYGLDADYQPYPQMLEGHQVEQDGRLWTLTLRPGLRFHDNEPVLSRDVAASLRRWGRVDSFGQALFAVTDELSEPDDRTVRLRLRAPFPHLPQALAKLAATIAFIMPARLAATPPTTPMKEIIGSGPFRFRADERVPGARLAYDRFDGYVPRPDGPPGTSGPKRVHLDRVEWLVMPEPATAAAALQSGEVDWLELPPPDLLPSLRRNPALTVRVNDPTGSLPALRFNCIHPPFDNAGIRRAVLGAVDQAEFLAAFSSDATLQRSPVGAFCPGTPMANDAGMDHVGHGTGIDTARRALAAAGYAGERIVVLGASDHPVNGVMSQVAVDLLRRLGMNAELRAMDAGTMFQARANREPVDHGGWSIFPTSVPGSDVLNPMTSSMVRGNGLAGWYGWPTDPLLEQLRLDWLQAPDVPAQAGVSRQVQAEAFDQALFIPLGQILQPTAYRNLVGVLPGWPKFWNVQMG